MKTILVPTDFSDYAFYALKTAACIAKKLNACVKLVHVSQLSSSAFAQGYFYKEYFDQYNQQIEKDFEKLLNQDFLKGLRTEKHFVVNAPMQELFRDDKFKDVDLIVIGSHGTSGINKFMIGSNTEKIIRVADAPVLTVKKEFEDFSFSNMVFASNFYEESYSGFKKIKFFADLYKAQIHLLKVVTPKHFEPTPVSKKLIEDFTKKFQLTNVSINIYNATSIENGITNFANEKKADMIALTTHGRTGLAYLIHGSQAENVALHEGRPVLSVKIKDTPVHFPGTD